MTPHAVDAHMVFSKEWRRSTSSSTHQPRSWSKAEAPENIQLISVTLSTRQLPSGRLNDEALWNIKDMVLTPEVSHALMSSLKDAAAELQ